MSGDQGDADLLQKEDEASGAPSAEWVHLMETLDPHDSGISSINDCDSDVSAIKDVNDLNNVINNATNKEILKAKALTMTNTIRLKDVIVEKLKVEAKNCRQEVFAVKSKRASFSQSQRRFVREEKQVHSGDNTVPYVSLSAAKRWLQDDSGGREEENKKWTEHRPEVVHKNLFDTWATLKMASTVTTVDPAVDMFHSVRGNGDTTIVMELSGVDHLDVAKHPYVHFLMFENLLLKMSQDLCLNATNPDCEKEFTSEKSKKSFFNFPVGTPDVQLMGRNVYSVAGQAIELLKEKVLLR